MRPRELWRNLGQPGMWEVLAELDKGEAVPRRGGEVDIPTLGRCNVERVMERRWMPASAEPTLIRMDVWQQQPE